MKNNIYKHVRVGDLILYHPPYLNNFELNKKLASIAKGIIKALVHEKEYSVFTIQWISGHKLEESMIMFNKLFESHMTAYRDNKKIYCPIGHPFPYKT